jgi:hypothetical protein
MIPSEVSGTNYPPTGIISSSLIIVILYIIPTFLSTGRLDQFSFWSLLLFSIALPLLAFTALVAYTKKEAKYTGTMLERTRNIIFYLGGGFAGAGIYSALSHISVPIGIAFLICTFILIPILVKFDNDVWREKTIRSAKVNATYQENQN